MPTSISLLSARDFPLALPTVALPRLSAGLLALSQNRETRSLVLVCDPMDACLDAHNLSTEAGRLSGGAVIAHSMHD